MRRREFLKSCFIVAAIPNVSILPTPHEIYAKAPAIEAMDFIHGMCREWHEAVFYGYTPTNPDKFDGLMARLP